MPHLRTFNRLEQSAKVPLTMQQSTKVPLTMQQSEIVNAQLAPRNSLNGDWLDRCHTTMSSTVRVSQGVCLSPWTWTDVTTFLWSALPLINFVIVVISMCSTSEGTSQLTYWYNTVISAQIAEQITNLQLLKQNVWNLQYCPSKIKDHNTHKKQKTFFKTRNTFFKTKVNLL